MPLATAPAHPQNPLARTIRAVHTDLFTGYTPFEKVFFATLIGLQILVSTTVFEGWLSAVTAVAGMICVILVGKGRISNYFFGVIQNVPYLILAFQAYFIGEITIAAFYVITQFWGLYIWRKNMRVEKSRAQRVATSTLEDEPRDVITRRLSLPQIGLALLILGFLIWGYGYLLTQWGSNQPYVDGFTTIIAVMAQILMVFRFREQWVGWLVLNAVQIYLWSTVDGGGNLAIMAMYAGFIANSLYGWYNWSKLSRPLPSS
ncbi:nicotinamide riboside transporter PnuC [Rothia sp. P100]|uniref:nicotinamide riboside transporter PnuC n=1 Tax=Rothia sp. P100 TaxID=2939578 RepID=UPI00203D1AC1|nr:nicotinamide riboside transporter PnuC [Rothia sp. P100]MCM3510657.1 nicotinamide riboside transporter PnuC [Rothia sp. P100]